jgi:hypothetical protein
MNWVAGDATGGGSMAEDDERFEIGNPADYYEVYY